MPDVIEVENHGPLVVSSTYWGSEYDRRGLIVASCNAGAVRVLLPRTARKAIPDMRAARIVILSRGPWPAAGKADATELLFEDGTGAPFSLHLGPESWIGGMPAEPEPGREWVCTVWDCKKGRPHCAVTRRCVWRRVHRLPWLRPLDG